MLLSLGDFVFELEDKAYQSFRRTVSFGLAKTERPDNLPRWIAAQTPSQKIVIGGKYLPVLRGGSTEDDLVALGNRQLPVEVITGNGDFLGMFVVVSVDIAKRSFLADGTALVVDFTVEIEEAAND